MINNAFSNYENACALAMFNQRHGLKHIPSHQQDKSGQFTWSRAQKTATDVFGKQREISCSFEKPVASWSWLFFIREIDREKNPGITHFFLSLLWFNFFSMSNIWERNTGAISPNAMWNRTALVVQGVSCTCLILLGFFKDTSMFCFVFFFITLYIY